MNQLATDLLNQTRSDDEMSIQTAALLRQAADAIEEAEKVNAKLFADYVSVRGQLVKFDTPTAWVVRWKGGRSIYFTEDEANRAAENVRKYAHYRDAVVFPVYAKTDELGEI